MKLDILAFGAHPDDIEISAGGMLISEARKGRKIGLIDLTRGEMGTRGTAEIRDVESLNAMKIIGAVLRENLTMRDAYIETNSENLEKVIRVIRKYQPEIVLTNAPSDRHPDHGHAASLVVDACFKSGLRKYLIDGTGENAWRPKAIYQYMQFYQHKPDFIYDVSETIDEKLRSVLAHESQFFNPDSIEPETTIASFQFRESIKARALEYGLQAGFDYGEPYMVRRPVGVKNLMDLY
jgi:bacillithiol biosynthesis deacetylase BshB1